MRRRRALRLDRLEHGQRLSTRRTGKLLWTYDPKVPRETLARACCDAVNRGVARLERQASIVGTLDGRLIALDAATGTVVWATLTVDPTKPYTITGAPRVVNGKVIIGNGGAEFGVRGYVSAYDADDGNEVVALLHRARRSRRRLRERRTGAAPPRRGAASGGSRRRRHRLGLDRLRPGARPALHRHRQRRAVEPARSAARAAATICICRRSSRCTPDTGEYVWHYQATPGESWDYTATQQMILADLDDRRAAAQGADAGAEERLLLRARSRRTGS